MQLFKGAPPLRLGLGLGGFQRFSLSLATPAPLQDSRALSLPSQMAMEVFGQGGGLGGDGHQPGGDGGGDRMRIPLPLVGFTGA